MDAWNSSDEPCAGTTWPKYFACKTSAFNYGVSVAIPKIYFHNVWEEDTIASRQNWDPRFWYGENWYGYAP